MIELPENISAPEIPEFIGWLNYCSQTLTTLSSKAYPSLAVNEPRMRGGSVEYQ